MLRRDGPGAAPGAADAAALPFRDGRFDLVLAAFCLNHLASLAAGLAEARRVGGALAASTFAPGWTHPAKDAVDEVLRAVRLPPAGLVLRPSAPGSRGQRSGAAGRGGGRGRLRRRAGAHDSVPTGLSAPAELASWRLGMAHFAPFLRSLDRAGPGRRRAAGGARGGRAARRRDRLDAVLTAR